MTEFRGSRRTLLKRKEDEPRAFPLCRSPQATNMKVFRDIKLLAGASSLISHYLLQEHLRRCFLYPNSDVDWHRCSVIHSLHSHQPGQAP